MIEGTSRYIYPSAAKIAYSRQKPRKETVMRKADTRKVKFVKDNTLIVAIDVGMEMNHGYCTTPDGRDIKPFKFDNTREGMDKLWGMVMASKNRFQCGCNGKKCVLFFYFFR